MPERLCLRFAFACAVVVCAGCDAMTKFRTSDGQVFNGEVVGSDSETRKDEASFIREGFVSHTQMDLTFDPFEASRAQDLSKPGVKPRSPGTLTTYVCSDDEIFCARNHREPGDFRETKLEPFVRLNQDALSEYDFPGGGRLRNYILGARFESQLESGNVPRNAMIFLSLMESGKIEVRVVSASVLDQDGAEMLPALFGVFVLDKRKQ